jgi:hypothetical protein
MSDLLNYHIQTVDSTPLESELSATILEALRSREFVAQDVGHHIAVRCPNIFQGHFKNQEPWDCAIIYLEDNTLWIKAIAQRWWCLFNLVPGDEENDPKYQAFWEAIDSLDPLWKSFEASGGNVQQGTMGELQLNKRKLKQASPRSQSRS